MVTLCPERGQRAELGIIWVLKSLSVRALQRRLSGTSSSVFIQRRFTFIH